MAKMVKMRYVGRLQGVQVAPKTGGIYYFKRDADTDVPEDVAKDLLGRGADQFAAEKVTSKAKD